MPLPLTTFFRPDSVSKGGTCKMNLRGGNLYDYADSNAVWTDDGSLTVSPIPENTSWTYFIKNKFIFATNTTVTRSSQLSTQSTNFTVMFRFYIVSLEDPMGGGTSVIFNGTPPGPAFWGIFMNGVDRNSLQFQFVYTQGGSFGSQIISSEYIQANIWYHVAVTMQDNGDGTDTYTGFLNGIRTSQDFALAKLDAPSGNTTIGFTGSFPQDQGFQTTELVFLEKALTIDEIRAYATSPYI